VADGTTYEIDIPVTGGAQASAAATSIDALAAALDRARGASSAAAQAVAAGSASYASAETAANRAAMAAERMGVSVAAQQGKLAAVLETGDTSAISAAEEKLASLVARQGEAEAKSQAAAAALSEQASGLDGLRAAAAAAAEEEATLASRLEAATQAEEANAAAAKETAAATEGMGASAGGGNIKLGELSESLGKLGGPAGAAGQKVASVGNAVSKLAAMGPAGIFVAIAVATIAVVSGLAMATIGMLKFGLANADAARTSALLSQGIAGSVEGGLALDKTISGLGSKVPIAADELRNMAADLAKSGLKGDELSAALETAAVKAAKLKFGPDFAKQMLSADYQSQKLKADVGKIFGGLKIEGFLTALQKGAALFDENSAAAKAIKVVFESMFQPLVDGMAGAVPKLIAGFLQFEIWALRSLIAVQRYQPVFDVVGTVVMAWLTGIGQSFGLIYDGAAFALGGLVAIGEGGAAALGWLSAKALEVRAFLQGLSLADVGMAMVQGLANGITGGGAAVLAAITGVAGSAIAAAKKSLGIKSPSKVFAEIGGYTSEGMAQGVDAGADAVQGSLEAMVAPPAAGAAGAPSGAPAPATSSGGMTVTIGSVVFHVGGDEAGGKKAFAEFMNLLEGLAQQGGGMVPSA
jgi:hypothetical protein